MKPLVLLLLVALLLTACAAPATPPPPTAPPPSPTSAPTEALPTDTPLPTMTPQPTVTPLPTATPGPSPTPAPFTLTSPAFEEGGVIPLKYTFTYKTQCGGDNYSPPLAWTGVPAGTQSFAILAIDPDGGDWVHWVQFDIPADQNGLPEAIGGPSIGVKGMTYFHVLGYSGPCPPFGTHHYVFTIYALDTFLSLPEGADKDAVEAAMQGHILGKAHLMGIAKP